MPHVLTAAQRAHVDRLVGLLKSEWELPERVLEAYRRVPRHCFVERLYVPDPDAGAPTAVPVAVTPDSQDEAVLRRIYTDQALCTKVRDGVCTSSTSQPSLMASMMLDAELQPGLKVLEIGTATGWNAALMSEVVAPGGRVVSLEYDPEPAAEAQRHLAREGFASRVTAICGDGVEGHPAGAPYDAVVVTVSCPDIPRAWHHQLGAGGRLVMPFALRVGAAPILCLRRCGDRLEGRFVRWSWFVGLQGGGLAPLPDPLDLAAEPGLACLLEQPVGAADLPWAADEEARWNVLAFGFQLEIAEPERLRAVACRPHEQHRLGRLALCDAAAGSLAVIDGATVSGYGTPLLRDRVVELAEAWTRAGRPDVFGYHVTAVETMGGAQPPCLVRGQTTLLLTRTARGD